MRRGFVALTTTGLLLGIALCAASEPITPKEKTPLWNGKDFTGWKLFVREKGADPKETFTAAEGEIRCTGKPAGYMQTEAEYTNYKLHVEWRWPGEAGNSGVLLHKSGPDKTWPRSIEAQLMNRNAGDFFVIEGTEFKEHAELVKGSEKPSRRVPKREESSEKPLGEWNSYDIVCKDNSITLRVNGVLQNQATEANVSSGHIGLQSEGKPIRFRNIYIEPLD